MAAWALVTASDVGLACASASKDAALASKSSSLVVDEEDEVAVVACEVELLA